MESRVLGCCCGVEAVIEKSAIEVFSVRMTGLLKIKKPSPSILMSSNIFSHVEAADRCSRKIFTPFEAIQSHWRCNDEFRNRFDASEGMYPHTENLCL